MKVPRYSPEQEFYRDADGYDVAQDSRWNEVDPSMFHDDPSLDDWPRHRRTLVKPPIHREDFHPTRGLSSGCSTSALPVAASSPSPGVAGSRAGDTTPF